MLVMLMEAVPTSLRGELTRWLSPLSATMFAGRVSPTVRDLLWQKCCENARTGRVIQAWSAPQTERGFEFRVHGVNDIAIVDLEGLPFLCTRDAAWAEARDRFQLLREGDP
jgi:CRISPR-associated protein Cas2